MFLPKLVVHADWGSDESKRRMAKAVLRDDGSYAAFAPGPVGELRGFLDRLLNESGSRGSVLVGFDFPIGLPVRYAKKAGISDFVDMLLQLGCGEWFDFYRPAVYPEEISVRRPFYPYRPGGTKQEYLVRGLGMEYIDELYRQCERKHGGRQAASPLFWTLGPKQVGKAAIVGWHDVLSPVLQDDGIDVKIWPFQGSLGDLMAPGRVVVVETYPAEFYTHLGIVFGLKGGKGDQASRKANASALFGWSANNGVVLEAPLESAIKDGFGHGKDGDDSFDAVVGLFGMLNVLFGRRDEGVPPDEDIRKIEGWILGQLA